MSKKRKELCNYLDLIPERAPMLKWHTDEKGLVALEVENTGVFHAIAQKAFKKPRFTQVHLDGQGSFLWPLMDGKKSIMELAALQKEKFGEKAEPLYPRIVKYFQIMESYGFIRFTNRQKR